MCSRAIVFAILGVVLLIVTNALFLVLEIGSQYEWYLPLLIAIGLAFIYSFFPRSCSLSLALVLVVPLRVIVATLQLLTFILTLILIFSAGVIVIMLWLVLYGIVGLFLVGGAYLIGGELIASIGAIVFVAILLATLREAFERALWRLLLIWGLGWQIAGTIVLNLAGFWIICWVIYPCKTIEAIWIMAEGLGKLMGGDITQPSYKSESALPWLDEIGHKYIQDHGNSAEKLGGLMKGHGDEVLVWMKR